MPKKKRQSLLQTHLKSQTSIGIVIIVILSLALIGTYHTRNTQSSIPDVEKLNHVQLKPDQTTYPKQSIIEKMPEHPRAKVFSVDYPTQSPSEAIIIRLEYEHDPDGQKYQVGDVFDFYADHLKELGFKPWEMIPGYQYSIFHYREKDKLFFIPEIKAIENSDNLEIILEFGKLSAYCANKPHIPETHPCKKVLTQDTSTP